MLLLFQNPNHELAKHNAHPDAEALHGNLVQLWEERNFVMLDFKQAMPLAGYAYAKTYIEVESYFISINATENSR
ncbi:MAG: hypothetical protein RM338_32780 [Nostoc sp. DedQUE12a]|nr:hypothetical protein [Nostoc sp. DedQUE12a]